MEKSHKEMAAEIFDVPVEEVTPTQRQVIKMWRHGANYSMGQINAGRLLGQYPIKVEPF